MEYGLQLYSVRDFTGKDLAYALEKVAEMGYKYVEFAGFFGHPAEEVKAMLDNYGLKVSGTHTGFGEVTNNFAETVKYHKTIGNTNIIIPGHDLGSMEKIDVFVKEVEEYLPKLKAEGIELGYHNHAHEFQPNADGSMIHEELEKRTDITFEIDTYWAYVAHLDPVETITRLKDRIKFIHLKDGTQDGHGLSLGSGTAPVKAVREKAIELGLTMVVESESLTPDGISEVKRCIDFLNSLE